MKNIELLINRYLDGEATNTEIKQVDNLLKEDNEFKKKFSDYEKINRVLNTVDNVIVSDDISKRVINSIKYKEDKSFIIGRFIPAVMGSLASCVLAIIISTSWANYDSNILTTSDNDEEMYSHVVYQEFTDIDTTK